MKNNIELFKKEICNYYSIKNANKIINTLDFATQIHKNQPPRPDGNPYIYHLINVALNTFKISKSKKPYLIITSLLHDSIEDQSINIILALSKSDKRPFELKITKSLNNNQKKALDLIKDKFGLKVAKLLSILTNPDFEEMIKKLKKKSITKSKNELYLEHIRKAIKNPEVLLIKYADFCDNALKLNSIPDKVIRAKLNTKYKPLIILYYYRFVSDKINLQKYFIDIDHIIKNIYQIILKQKISL